MEEGFRHITHKRQSIVLLDLSSLQDEMEIPRLLKLRSTLRMPHGLLADLTGTHFIREIMRAEKEKGKAIRPLIKAFAVVGTGSMVSVLVDARTAANSAADQCGSDE